MSASRRGAYTFAASTCALLAFVGFSRTYYLKGLFGTAQLPVILHIHGFVMTAWFALVIAQTCFVASSASFTFCWASICLISSCFWASSF